MGVDLSPFGHVEGALELLEVVLIVLQLVDPALGPDRGFGELERVKILHRSRRMREASPAALRAWSLGVTFQVPPSSYILGQP